MLTLHNPPKMVILPQQCSTLCMERLHSEGPVLKRKSNHTGDPVCTQLHMLTPVADRTLYVQILVLKRVTVTTAKH